MLEKGRIILRRVLGEDFLRKYLIVIRESSNGRTRPSGGRYLGSNPGSRATLSVAKVR